MDHSINWCPDKRGSTVYMYVGLYIVHYITLLYYSMLQITIYYT